MRNPTPGSTTMFSNWTTPEEMHRMLVEDGDIDPDETTVDDVAEMLDEMVEDGVMRSRFGRYQLTSAEAAAEFIDKNTE